MRKSLLAVAAATVVMSGVAFAADVTTTTTWSDDYGNTFREYSTTKHYAPVTDPNVDVKMGVEVPASVKLYALPETVKVPDRDRYEYVVINDHPVVVEKKTRHIIHVW